MYVCMYVCMYAVAICLFFLPVSVCFFVHLCVFVNFIFLTFCDSVSVCLCVCLCLSACLCLTVSLCLFTSQFLHVCLSHFLLASFSLFCLSDTVFRYPSAIWVIGLKLFLFVNQILTILLVDFHDRKTRNYSKL